MCDEKVYKDVAVQRLLFVSCKSSSQQKNTFKLIPLFHHSRMHIRYDSVALRDMLSRLNITRATDFDANRDWARHFNFKKLEKGKSEFNYSIQTDGVAISFQMHKLIKKGESEPEQQQREKHVEAVRERLLAGKYDSFIGLDPGFRLLVAGVRRTSDHQLDGLIKESSKQYRHDTKQFRRRHKLRKWSKDVEEKAHSTLSPTNADFRAYTRHRLE